MQKGVVTVKRLDRLKRDKSFVFVIKLTFYIFLFPEDRISGKNEKKCLFVGMFRAQEKLKKVSATFSFSFTF